MKVENSLGRALAGTGSVVDFSGTWKNELTSKMDLAQTGDKISGTYESAVSGSGSTTVGDLVGFADGDLLSILVHWRDFQAITAWVGQLGADQKSLNTLWNMVKQVESGQEWSSINAGADRFTKD